MMDYGYKRLKVLHILNTGDYSGAENVVITMIDAYKDKVEGIYCGKKGPIESILKKHGIQFRHFSKMTTKSIRKIINESKPDIIHAHDYTAGLICAASGTKIPIINHVHNNSPWIKKINIKSILYAGSCLRYKKILTVSPSVMDEYVFGKKFKDKTVVIGNPINIHKIQQLAREEKEKIYDIAFLGRLSPPKNPQLFLEIVDEVKKQVPNLKSIMIGSGELKDEIEEIIEHKGLESTINLMGFKSNPYQLLRSAKILLMPSSWEGYGLAAVEALSLGLPVVCSNVGGLPTIVNDDCGKLCKKKQDYVDEIVRQLGEGDYYLSKSLSAIKRAEELDNLNEYKDEVLNIYDEVLC